MNGNLAPPDAEIKRLSEENIKLSKQIRMENSELPIQHG